MFNLSRTFLGFKFVNRYIYQRNYALKASDIVIVSAVRTPLACLENTATGISASSKLMTYAIDGAIKRAALPRNVIDGLHIVSAEQAELTDELNIFDSELLTKDICQSRYIDDFEALKIAANQLEHGQAKSIIVTTLDAIPAHKFNDNIWERLKLATSKGLYDEEVVPITFRSQKSKQMVTQSNDACEALGDGSTHHFIATALALTTIENANSINIKPSARLSMKLVNSSSQDSSSLVQQLLPNADVSSKNSDSIAEIFGLSVSNTTALDLVHAVHKLKPKQQECLNVSQKDGYNAAILLENSNDICNSLPLLTLYTKDPCPLCDTLMAELENDFNNEYQLEKVYIDRKENVRFLRLYRYDIPVLFFNGQFLCMHRLNSTLLRRKIDQDKNGGKLNRMILD